MRRQWMKFVVSYIKSLDMNELLVTLWESWKDVAQSLTTPGNLYTPRDFARGLSAPENIFGLLILDRIVIVDTWGAGRGRRVRWMGIGNTIRNRGEGHSFVLQKRLLLYRRHDAVVEMRGHFVSNRS
jgi:hypothetical protein